MSRVSRKEDVVERLKQELPYLRERYGVRKVALYGSLARAAQTQTSDVDLLIELSRPLGLEFIELAYYLEKVLGRRVDLATFEAYNRSRLDPKWKRIALDIEGDLIYVS